MNDPSMSQIEICRKFGAVFMPSPEGSRAGVAGNVCQGMLPINGLRHPPEGETSGWFIWAGESICEEDGWFKPVHVEHLVEWCPQVIKYLGLSPGWRFLIADGYEDVWFDSALLNI
jgi:hypothetical protein